MFLFDDFSYLLTPYLEGRACAQGEEGEKGKLSMLVVTDSLSSDCRNLRNIKDILFLLAYKSCRVPCICMV